MNITKISKFLMIELQSIIKRSCKNVFVYPKLPAVYNLGFIRYRGSGLANCLFIAARAYLLAHRNEWNLINPTWNNLVLGPYLRYERDKRHYFGILKKTGISGLLKLYYLFFTPTITIEDAINGKKGKIIIDGLGNYFEDLIDEQKKLKVFIYSILQNKTLSSVEHIDFKNIIGIHIRLGDYPAEFRTSIIWYEKVVKEIIANHASNYKFFIFSDGHDNELQELLLLPQVERVFFGNAISDIIALSKCKLIIGSDSTFTGWAAFLDQAPTVFPKKHFGKVLINHDHEFIEDGDSEKLKKFLHTYLT